MMGKRGRPPKSGDRYPSGKLKQTAIEPIAPATWQRIATDAKRGAIDARLGTELGRLSLHGELTARQVSAGFRVAQVYQTWERFKGRGRSARSPSYGAAGDSSIAEELMDPDALRDLEEAIRSAQVKWDALQAELDKRAVPRSTRGAMEDLCAGDRVISPQRLDEVAVVLDHLAVWFGIVRKDTRRPQTAKTGVVAAAAQPRENLDRKFFLEVQRRLRPDLTEEDLELAYDSYRTLVARAVFRRSKQQRKDNVVVLDRRK